VPIALSTSVVPNVMAPEGLTVMGTTMPTPTEFWVAVPSASQVVALGQAMALKPWTPSTVSRVPALIVPEALTLSTTTTAKLSLDPPIGNGRVSRSG